MTTVNVHEAKTHLSRLIDRAAAGEEITLAKAGRPVARLVPLDQGPRRRRGGQLAGLVTLDESFFDPLPEEELRLWNGE